MASLSLAERTALEARCTERMGQLAAQGLGIAGVESRLLVELISQLLGPDQLDEAKERWLYWLADQLDGAESEIRRRILASGLVNGAGAPAS